MEAREFLQRLRRLNITISQKEQELDFLRGQAEYRGYSMDGAPGSSSATDTIGNYAAKIVDAERELATDKANLLELREEIVNAIQTLDDPTCADLLYRRYVLCESWKTIAADMQYSHKHVSYFLHRKALEKLNALLHEKVKAF